ncbi:MAG: NAD(P)-dependent oxidoreductase [Candidatus Omnitrophica bacterium]|nr:NAD(P)-dependent oxidoreductase [Candidatus Omnitrophota bacterium]
MSKIVVFGGAGFLGSHVKDVLSKEGHRVIIYDLIKPSSFLKNQKIVIGDILDEKKVFDTVKDCDIVYHFAGVADIEDACRNPLESIKKNILGTAIVLEACRKAKVKRFIFASSLYVYSKSGSFYRSAKQSCELLIENYHESYGLNYTILRYGSLYGPRAGKGNFLHSVLYKALEDGLIEREGDGEEIREYIHVTDAARCSVEILVPEFKNQCVMISGTQQIKIKDLLLMIKEILGNKVRIKYLPVKSKSHYEITPYSFSPRLAKKFVSKTYVDLGQGILSCLEEAYQQINISK